MDITDEIEIQRNDKDSIDEIKAELNAESETNDENEIQRNDIDSKD